MLLIVLLATSCSGRKQLITTETIVKEVVRDSIISIPPDSAWLYAWLECDSLNQLQIKQVDIAPGSRIVPKVTFELTTGLVKVDCSESDSLRLLVALRDKEISTLQQETTYIEVPRKLNWWQQTIQVCGYLFLVLIVLTILKKLIK